MVSIKCVNVLALVTIVIIIIVENSNADTYYIGLLQDPMVWCLNNIEDVGNPRKALEFAYYEMVPTKATKVLAKAYHKYMFDTLKPIIDSFFIKNPDDYCRDYSEQNSLNNLSSIPDECQSNAVTSSKPRQSAEQGMQAILDGLPIGNMPRRNLINTGHLLLNQNQPVGQGMNSIFDGVPVAKISVGSQSNNFVYTKYPNDYYQPINYGAVEEETDPILDGIPVDILFGTNKRRSVDQHLPEYSDLKFPGHNLYPTLDPQFVTGIFNPITTDRTGYSYSQPDYSGLQNLENVQNPFPLLTNQINPITTDYTNVHSYQPGYSSEQDREENWHYNIPSALIPAADYSNIPQHFQDPTFQPAFVTSQTDPATTVQFGQPDILDIPNLEGNADNYRFQSSSLSSPPYQDYSYDIAYNRMNNK